MKTETLLQREKKIYWVKQIFENYFSEAMHLTKISSPLFVESKTGVQDDLNGVEMPVKFSVKQIQESSFEIVHSLAKWKRSALARFNLSSGEGIYTDMRAVRPDELDLLTGIHSIYVDQWDWEQVISKDNREMTFLLGTVRRIYQVIKQIEEKTCEQWHIPIYLPDEIYFISSHELAERFPSLSPRQREDAICREKQAVFITHIGGELKNGEKHDGRAPDYDDWSLNGDIIFWYPILGRALEISSMGIRVDAATLLEQLTLSRCEHRKDYLWHKSLLNDEFPLSIGGGIGQSRLLMFLLRKRHIGEVQVSVWPKQVHQICAEQGICLLR